MFCHTIGSDTLNDLNAGFQYEWLVTNGTGGFASSTVTGCNTRRYHGLLTAANPSCERHMFLSKLEESVTIGNSFHYFSTNKYLDNCIHPRGHIHLRKFELKPFPKFTYTSSCVTLTKEILMIRGSNTTIIRYELFSADDTPFVFQLHPLVSFRNFHLLQKENSDFSEELHFENSILKMQPYQDQPTLRIKIDNLDFQPVKNWYKNFQYDKEVERGLDYLEDLFHPGFFYSPETNYLKTDVIVTIEEKTDYNIDKEYGKAVQRVEELVKQAEINPWNAEENALVQAADMHIASCRQNSEQSISTIIAGYPWFGDWGRDTFISFPGLTLATGRFKEAKEILKHFGSFCTNGLIPNKFADVASAPVYNTADASLWYINGVYQYGKYTEDYEFIRQELFPVCESIIENYKNGTDFNIRMEEDYLITAGSEGVQLTWMDAIVKGVVITPRHGKPVEINALWYNALCIAGELSERFGNEEKTSKYRTLAEKVKDSFNQKFWYEREGYLHDTLTGDIIDSSIRPNMLYAVSLPFAVLDESCWKQVVKTAYEKLYTPFGLLSLNRENSRYRPYYIGPPEERDAAYHMGVAWGYLLGPFIEAFMKAEKFSEIAVARAKAFADTWAGSIYNACIGTLGEIFDGEEPFISRGCISQAWTIAELLRIRKLINQYSTESAEKNTPTVDTLQSKSTLTKTPPQDEILTEKFNAEEKPAEIS